MKNNNLVIKMLSFLLGIRNRQYKCELPTSLNSTYDKIKDVVDQEFNEELKLSARHANCSIEELMRGENVEQLKAWFELGYITAKRGNKTEDYLSGSVHSSINVPNTMKYINKCTESHWYTYFPLLPVSSHGEFFWLINIERQTIINCNGSVFYRYRLGQDT